MYLSLPETLDVLIVGAGPVGMTLALELHRQGLHNLAIVDKNELCLEYKGKGIGLVPRTLEIFDSYNIEIKEAHPVDSIDYIDSSGLYRTLEMDPILKVSKYGHLKQVAQSVTESYLRIALEERGIHIIRPIEVITFEEMGDYTKIIYKHMDKEYKTKVKYLAACDGARSMIRKQLNIEYKGETRTNTHYVFGFETDSKEFDRNSIQLGFYKQTGWVMLPLDTRTAAFYCELKEHESEPFLSDREVDRNGLRKPIPISNDKMEEYMNKRGVKLNVIKPVWVTHFRVNNRYAESYWNGKNIFLVGDAAHSSDPALGLGLNVGVQDAQNLGWKLAMVVKGHITPKILETYSQERKADGRFLMAQVRRNNQTILMSDYTRQTVMSLFSSFPLNYYIGFEDQVLGAAKLKFTYKNDYIIDNNYRLGGFIRDVFVNKHKAGEVLFTCTLKHSRNPDFLNSTPGFKVLAFSNNIKLVEDEIKRVVDKFDIITDIFVVKWNSVYRNYGILGPCLVLLRPDGHSTLVDNSFDYALLVKCIKNFTEGTKAVQSKL